MTNAMDKYWLYITTMGRGYEEDKEYFWTLGAVGAFVIGMLK